MTDANRPTASKRSRAQRVLTPLIAGAGVDEISATEQVTRKRTESILRHELRNRWVAPAEEFARLQIARLEQMILKLLDRIQSGELEAIDRALKIVDRLDRYHGFHESQARTRTIWRRRARSAPAEDQRDCRAASARTTTGMTDKAAHAAGTRGARHQRSRSGASERIKRITDLVNLDLDARVLPHSQPQSLQIMTEAELLLPLRRPRSLGDEKALGLLPTALELFLTS